MTEQSGDDIFGLLIALDELLLEELFKYVQDHLIEKQYNWIQNNFFLVVKTAYNRTNFQKLYDHCITTVCENPLPIFHSNDFLSLDKDTLLNLLESDCLRIKEIIVWDSLIKWGIEQTPELRSKNSYGTRWNQRNFEALKKTLSQFIPLIRFMEISPDDFFDKVSPYKAVIPINIYEELEGFYYKGAFPKTISMGPRIPSTIIKPSLVPILVNWIDGNDPNVLPFNNKYKFNLIYLKSRDGFDCKTFHDKCNGQRPFIILIKVQSKKIYGGYNPIGYNERNQWLSSSESFIFSFENDQDKHNMKIGRVSNTTKSAWEIYNLSFINFENHLYLGRSNQYLYIKEIEVFSVVKNDSFI